MKWLLLYTTAFLIAIQVFLVACLPLDIVYRYRLDYDVIKDNLADVNTSLDAIKREIQRRKLNDYVVLLGDSVMYSGPGGPTQSLGYFLNQKDGPASRELPPVFNLAVPAAQMGDFYAMLLMLDEKGISTDRVVLDLTYGGFVKRDPDPPIVYWLERELARLDPKAYREVASALALSKENKNRPDFIESFLEYEVYPLVPVLKYKDFLRAALERRLGIRPLETGDPRPWQEKAYLRELLKEPPYTREFDPSPLSLDDTNPNVAFLKRIAEHQRGKHLLVFMTPINKQLMSDQVGKPGFTRNMAELNAFMEGMSRHYGFAYFDLSDAIPYELFSDHVHLTGEGYRTLAGILRRRILATWG